MSLTAEEKAAGRAFRAWCQGQLDQVPADARCSPYTVWYRHACRDDGQGGTRGLRLRQHYWLSPAFPAVAEGRFAFISRQGACPRCGLAVRSGTGRFVLAAGNPPEKGAVVAHPDGAVLAGQASTAHPS